MNGKLLPADTYIVINKTILSDQDKKKITMLYQPIIGHTAVSLYLTLIDDLEKRELMSNELTLRKSGYWILLKKLEVRVLEKI